MTNNLKKASKEIATQLYYTYNKYYNYIWFGFIIEAVENTLKDFEMEVKPLDEIHRHIVANYL